jgi:hypothetical protein
MIPVTELRIGNKFHMIESTLVQTVLEIMDNTNRGKIEYNSDHHKACYSHLIMVEENRNQYKPIEMDGIPITQGYLLKYGFSLIEESPFQDMKMKYWVKEGLCLFFNESPPFNTYLVGFADQRFGKYSIVTGEWIKYVHTLQNTFYAFRGKEMN